MRALRWCVAASFVLVVLWGMAQDMKTRDLFRQVEELNNGMLARLEFEMQQEETNKRLESFDASMPATIERIYKHVLENAERNMELQKASTDADIALWAEHHRLLKLIAQLHNLSEPNRN